MDHPAARKHGQALNVDGKRAPWGTVVLHSSFSDF